MELKDKWYFDQLKEVHKRKLNLINSNSTKRIDNSPPTTLQISKSRVASYQNLRNQEYHEIYRKNQVILDALNEISNRKVKLTQIKTQTIYSPGVKSLNINFRNKITRKIIEENELILQKLSSKGSTISLKKFDEEFKLSLKYKKNLTRRIFNESPKKGLKKKKLPKIERSQVMSKAIKSVKSESNLRERKTEVPRDGKKSFEEVKEDKKEGEREKDEGLKEKQDVKVEEVKEVKEGRRVDGGNEEAAGAKEVEEVKKEQKGGFDVEGKIEGNAGNNDGISELKKRESLKQDKVVNEKKMEDENKADKVLEKSKSSSRSSRSSSSKRSSKSKSSESKSSESSNKKD